MSISEAALKTVGVRKAVTSLNEALPSVSPLQNGNTVFVQYPTRVVTMEGLKAGLRSQTWVQVKFSDFKTGINRILRGASVISQFG